MHEFEKARELLNSGKDFLVVSHYDADGLTSGAIASLVLDRLGISHDVRPVKKLDEKTLDSLGDYDAYWFVDLGSGQMDMIDSRFDFYMISDHHEPLEFQGRGIHMNAHLLGLDGTKEISGAGMVYLLARYLSKENLDLSAIAIIGAVGDMQDSTGRLIGRNREILEDGRVSGVLEVKTDLRLFGRHTRPLIQFLSYSTDPFLPGLTGNDAGCARFLENLGIKLKDGDIWRRYVDLSESEKKRLVDGLVVYGLDSGIDEKSLRAMIGEVYELSREPERDYTRDAKDFATLLNACGRHGEMDIGIAVAKGDRGKHYKKAVAILQRHRKALHDAIKWVVKNGVEDRGSFYLIDARGIIDEGIVGIVAGMVYNTGIVSRDKPIVALANDEEGGIKVSSRGNWDLVNRGLDLGEAMRKTTKEIGGVGGGHTIAAGATISKESKPEFLEKLGEIIKKQLDN